MVVMSAPTVHINNQPFLEMTSLNSRLHLALLNHKKGRNLIEKGFTLVELMIVIVIVGILSSVALPNFLSQQDKARATEGKQQISTILKASYADYQANVRQEDAEDAATAAIDVANANSENFTYDSGSTGMEFEFQVPPVVDNTTGAITQAGEEPRLKILVGTTGALAGKGFLGGCVALDTGKIEISQNLTSPLDISSVECPDA